MVLISIRYKLTCEMFILKQINHFRIYFEICLDALTISCQQWDYTELLVNLGRFKRCSVETKQVPKTVFHNWSNNTLLFSSLMLNINQGIVIYWREYTTDLYLYTVSFLVLEGFLDVWVVVRVEKSIFLNRSILK